MHLALKVYLLVVLVFAWTAILTLRESLRFYRELHAIKQEDHDYDD
jgi:hypothetical protein